MIFISFILLHYLNGDIELSENETIKIVGHSHGAAYAAGIATAIMKSKYSNLLEFVDYLSPHQPWDIQHPEGVPGTQFSTQSDWVSSWGPLARATNSRFGFIKNIHRFYFRGKYKGGRGGHSVETWLDDLKEYYGNRGVEIIEREKEE